MVDAIVVYKVDRLTRSLADFAKMVEITGGLEVAVVSTLFLPAMDPDFGTVHIEHYPSR